MSSLPAPSQAHEVFHDALPLAERYTAFLAGPGVERGLIGPREVARLWDRHVHNCAVLTFLVPDSPYLFVNSTKTNQPNNKHTNMRTVLSVTLLEPLLRRT